ncbi:hypothetical protein IFR04_016092 [Cadophora malorum]|uniref:Uncharacterized protein n=1 Tax=Cadophora malorum TaxID=108018 RepID=A0A8H7VYV1_9HELO|nr:hypothetical protein IFR04_016092 [Cadophora malorum]
MRRATYSIDIIIRMYNEVPWNSEVMILAQHGNVERMQNLFDSGFASPFDRCGGKSLLHAAIFGYQADIYRFLLQMGSSIETGLDDDRLDCIDQLLCSGPESSNGDGYWKTLNALAYDADVEDPFGSFYCYGSLPRTVIRGDAEVLTWVLEKTESDYHQRSPELKVKVIEELLMVLRQPNPASLMCTLLANEKIDPSLFGIRTWGGSTLLNCTSWGLGEYYFYFNNTVVIYGKTLAVFSKRFTRKHTPLGGIIHSFAHLSYQDWRERFDAKYFFASPDTPKVTIWSPSITNILGALFTRLTTLQRVGVDIEEYGRREKQVWLSNEVHTTIRYGGPAEDTGRQGRSAVVYSTVIFSYCPNLSDWNFWFIELPDNSSVEFWEGL